MIQEIRRSDRFEKRYKRLPFQVKLKAEAKENIFRITPFDPRLGTHKLHGKDKEFLAFSIDRKYRIKFLFLNGDKVLFFDIGTHDEVY